MLHGKNYSNWSMLQETIQKIKVARFLWTMVYLCLPDHIGFAVVEL